MNFKPFKPYVLVEKISEDLYAKNSQGILIPTNHEDVTTDKVKVIAYWDMQTENLAYSFVHIPKGAGYPIQLDGKNYLLLKEELIFGGELND